MEKLREVHAVDEEVQSTPQPVVTLEAKIKANRELADVLVTAVGSSRDPETSAVLAQMFKDVQANLADQMLTQQLVRLISLRNGSKFDAAATIKEVCDGYENQ